MLSIGCAARLIGPLFVVFLLGGTVSAQLSLNPAPQTFSQNTAGFLDAPEVNDNLGAATASGDFNNDGFGDLAIAAPFEDIGSASNAGIVHVLYGTSNGLSTNNAQIWAQNSPGIEDQLEENDRFGNTLTAGDFNGDGFDDLVIGVQFENLAGTVEAGAIHVLYGAPGGLTAGGSQFWSQNSTGIEGAAETRDEFGASLTAGDFNGDGFDDLAVGVPGDKKGAVANAGAVNVIYGSPSGLTSANNQLWQEGSGGIAGVAEGSDAFGSAIAAGDFNNDGFDDLAVGVPGRKVGGKETAGAVRVIFGSSNRLTGIDSQFFTQDTPGVDDESDAFDRFGFGLAAGDFDGDGFDDVAIGVPGESVTSQAGAGAFHILFGSSGGITVAGGQFWTLDTPGVPGIAREGYLLGRRLAGRDFDNDGFDDLVAGVPNGYVGDTRGAGFLLVLYGRQGGLGLDGNQLWTMDDLGSTSNTSDVYGFSVAAGDFNGDGFGDVAAGSPGDNISSTVGAGSVSVIYGNRPPAAANDLQRMLRSLRQQNGRLGTLEEQLP